jgi:phage/plasmid-associated DNA primase
MMSNVVTLAVYRDNKNGIPTTEESHAKKEVYAAFSMWKKRAMFERDGISHPLPKTLETYPMPQGKRVCLVK